MYPKVLIIGQTFNNTSGGGITLTNLFNEWPNENLAVIASNIKNKSKINFDICSNYYFLGNSEIRLKFPLNLIYKISKSEIAIANYEFKINSGNNKTEKNILNQYLKKTIKILLKFSGLNFVKYQYTISDNLSAWIKSFNPDVIYSALGNLDLLRFIYNIKAIFDYKIAIHIWDDWPNTIFQKTIFPLYWKKKFNYEFDELIKKSDIRLSISDCMTKDYEKKYGRTFIAFHNPIDTDYWYNIKNLESKNNTIVYFGKINNDNIRSLKLMATIVDEINKSGKINIEFIIYTPQYFLFKNYFNKNNNILLHEPISHDKVPYEIKKASILFLPLDFSEKSVKYTRLSMPTKATEYMASGVPCIVLAHPFICLNIYTKEKGWAYLVEEFDKDKLKDAVLCLLNDSNLGCELVTKALKLARDMHSASFIREKFRRTLLGKQLV